jgi:hypothetical protein
VCRRLILWFLESAFARRWNDVGAWRIAASYLSLSFGPALSIAQVSQHGGCQQSTSAGITHKESRVFAETNNLYHQIKIRTQLRLRPRLRQMVLIPDKSIGSSKHAYLPRPYLRSINVLRHEKRDNETIGVRRVRVHLICNDDHSTSRNTF